VDLEQDRPGKPEDVRLVGKDPDDVGPALDLLVDPLEWVRRPDLASVADREGRERGHVLAGLGEHRRDDRKARLELGRDLVELLRDGDRVGLSESRRSRARRTDRSLRPGRLQSSRCSPGPQTPPEALSIKRTGPVEFS
jgi:hypothetical protein